MIVEVRLGDVNAMELPCDQLSHAFHASRLIRFLAPWRCRPRRKSSRSDIAKRKDWKEGPAGEGGARFASRWSLNAGKKLHRPKPMHSDTNKAPRKEGRFRQFRYGVANISACSNDNPGSLDARCLPQKRAVFLISAYLRVEGGLRCSDQTSSIVVVPKSTADTSR